MKESKERLRAVEENNRSLAYNDGCSTPIITLFVAVLLLCSCKTGKTVIGHTETSDSVRVVEVLKVDTIIEKDSVFVSVKEKGDTVFLETYKYKYIYKDKEVAVHDTIEVVKEKEIPVEVEVVKEVPRKRTWFETTQYYGFWLLLAAWGIKYRRQIMKSVSKFLD